ncbi:uncharacterized protein LOC126903919 isoform X2 [Daktulosphaira vitifoliae]|uniref:uncharacterized protein LOC126903919 isoform X2 n=1 Tax=Daktulosphaira vitifoliae TaxID=58002 RepID=UPI0021AA99EE|nr:uncharacterized protein LOC126903919 isoform X2 [Daktulosphaira vitifoliae]
MGNSNSHGIPYATSDTQAIPPHSWAYSFPRSQYFGPVGPNGLPQHLPSPRLRPPENGTTMLNGGPIISKRPYDYRDNDEFQRGYHVPRHYQHEEHRKNRIGYNMYNSEPDLRFALNQHQPLAPVYDHHHNHRGETKGRLSRSKKKYKAPQLPLQHRNGMESSSPDSYQHWENQKENSRSSHSNGMPRLRLFKTRAETNRKTSKDEITKNPENILSNKPLSGNLHRSMSSPQFQAELKRVTEKLREKEYRHPPVGRASESSSNTASEEHAVIAHDIEKRQEDLVNSNRKRLMADRAKNLSKSIPNLVAVDRIDDSVRYMGEGSSATGSNDENKNCKKIDKPKSNVSDNKPKTFYFGMNEFSDDRTNCRNVEDVKRFTENYKKSNPSPSDSLTSSDPTDESGGDISLQLRPTLPRKQFDIPRFSPTAAWRLLTALESPTPNSPNYSGGEEDLIQVIDQPHHNNGDKSGDSGISGDASPHSAHNSQVAWTPQQDLEETSSDGGLDSAPVSPQSLDAVQFSRSRTVARPSFCLSLPKEDNTVLDTRYGQSSEEFSPMNPPKASSYFKSKLNKTKVALEKSKSRLDDNWVLSKSVPDSLHKSGLVGNYPSCNWEQEEYLGIDEPTDENLTMSSLPKFSYLAAGRRAMYLPEYKSLNCMYPRSEKNNFEERIKNISQSCENLTRDNQKDDILPIKNDRVRQKKSASKKFAFQSTIRQIERRKIAEKLAKEAEHKERQRLSEMEAMRRVEEEFQRKREREKANIRQQLRLYTLTQGDREPAQPLPSGTQVLSEFREARRDYKDYNTSRNVEHDYNAESFIKKTVTTVHPKVVYQMPKSTPVYVTPNSSRKHTSEKGSSTSTSANYRRDFAQGALPHSVASSDSEVSVSHTRSTSRTNHRSRSTSPISDQENSYVDTDFDNANFTSKVEEECQLNSSMRNDGVTNEVIPTHGINTLQPFSKKKNSMYKPIFFNPIIKNKFAQPLI